MAEKTFIKDNTTRKNNAASRQAKSAAKGATYKPIGPSGDAGNSPYVNSGVKKSKNQQ